MILGDLRAGQGEARGQRYPAAARDDLTWSPDHLEALAGAAHGALPHQASGAASPIGLVALMVAAVEGVSRLGAPRRLPVGRDPIVHATEITPRDSGALLLRASAARQSAAVFHHRGEAVRSPRHLAEARVSVLLSAAPRGPEAWESSRLPITDVAYSRARSPGHDRVVSLLPQRRVCPAGRGNRQSGESTGALRAWSGQPARHGRTGRSARDTTDQPRGPAERAYPDETPSGRCSANLPQAAEDPVLIVDDDPEIRELLKICLKSEGFVVETAASGEEGLDRAIHRRPALVLADIDLPGMNGEEFATRLRRLYHGQIPFILVSASPRIQTIARRVGATSWLRKPFDLADLLATIQSALERDRS